jgi:hypothetical protein
LASSIKLLKIYPDSFIANSYTGRPFRMIGLVDVSIQYRYGIERVTVAYYRSSGTNSGKIRGLWYPIVGIKLYAGKFTEFTEYLNYVLSYTTSRGRARKGWLAKSLFFSHQYPRSPKIRGFTNGKHYGFLLEIGEILKALYEKDDFYYMKSLDAERLNKILTSSQIYQGNEHAQRVNYERFIEDIFKEY